MANDKGEGKDNGYDRISGDESTLEKINEIYPENTPLIDIANAEEPEPKPAETPKKKKP